jgi:hypothetical protein
VDGGNNLLRVWVDVLMEGLLNGWIRIGISRLDMELYI